MKKGIIFDLDGTLWDASEEITAIWNSVFSRHDDVNKQITVKDMQSYMGKCLEDIAKACLPHLPVSRSLEILHECCRVEIEYLKRKGAKLYINETATIHQLSQECGLYIVSNCQCGYIEAFLESSGLKNMFSDYESFGNTGLSKGENIKLVIKRNKIGKALYIGDTMGDYNAAKFAEIPFIHSKYGFGKVPDDNHYSVSCFEDIPRKAAEILNK